VIVVGDWVLICETKDKGIVVAAMDQNERFLVHVPPTQKYHYAKQVHVGIEKVRKIKPILQMTLIF
jgi:hypothetical protein